jgi:nucleoside-diphosphate-sugar epimerase
MFIVFGATGFIGRAVQSALRARGADYVGFGSAACVRSNGAAVSELDLPAAAERAALLRGLPQPEAIVFAAGTAITSTQAGILRTSHVDSLRQAFEIIPQELVERVAVHLYELMHRL